MKEVLLVLVAIFVMTFVFGVDLGKYLDLEWMKERAAAVYEGTMNFYHGYLAGYVSYVVENIKNLVNAAVRAVQSWI